MLAEFHRDEQGGLTARPLVREESDVSPRLSEAARQVAKAVPRMIDPSNRIKPDPNHLYRVTVIFCLQPGNCAKLMPFPDTVPIVIKSTRIVMQNVETP